MKRKKKEGRREEGRKEEEEEGREEEEKAGGRKEGRSRVPCLHSCLCVLRPCSCLLAPLPQRVPVSAFCLGQGHWAAVSLFPVPGLFLAHFSHLASFG